MSVQTFCTSLTRPERAAHAAAWARVRRLAVARDGHAGSPSAGVQTRIGPRRRQVHERGVGLLAGCRPGRPGRRGRGTAPGRSASHCRRAPGLAARVCRAAPPTSRALRVASDGLRPPLTSEPLRPSGRGTGAGRWPALTGCAPPTPTPTPCLSRFGVKPVLTLRVLPDSHPHRGCAGLRILGTTSQLRPGAAMSQSDTHLLADDGHCR